MKGNMKMFMRTKIINWIIQNKKYKSYLEIGCARGKNFNYIEIDKKISIDPLGDYATFKITSDEFFEKNRDGFDIIFIDGLHHDYQVMKDIENSLKIRTPNGIIMMHDCLPTTKQAQLKDRPLKTGNSWTGDCWRAFAYLRKTRPDLIMFTIKNDHGLGVIKPGKQICYDGSTDTYEDLVKNKNKMMNVIDWKMAKKVIIKI
jgi:hypothetical protein